MKQSLQQPCQPENDQETAANRHFAANFDTIINATGVGMWDWDLVKGEIVHSGQLERIAGYQKGEMPSGDMNARDLLIHPADRKRADEVIEACRTGRLESYEVEFRVRCKDGGIKWVQDRGAVAARDEQGIATRIVGMFYDINRFKQTEESLTEKVRLLDFAVSLSGIGTMSWDILADHLQYDSDFLEILGCAQTQAPHQLDALADYVHPDDWPQLHHGIHQYLAEKPETDVYAQQLRVRNQAGQYTWLMVTARVSNWDSTGSPIRVVASYLNVDRMVRAEQEAQSALQDAQETIEAMFDANPHMCVLFDEHFKPIDCNPAIIEYFGFANKEGLLAGLLPLLQNAIPSHQPNGKPSVTLTHRLQVALRDGINEFETYFDFSGNMVPMRITIKRISYQGGVAFVAYQVDLTSIKQNEDALRRQDSLLQAANAVAAQLMDTDTETFVSTLSGCLETLGKSLGVDRAYLWQNKVEDGTLCAHQICEWLNAGTTQYLDYGERQFCYDELLPGWDVMIDADWCVNAPLDEVEAGLLQGFPGLSDVQSVLLIPVILRGDFWGFLGFDDCRQRRSFSASEERIMRSAGMLIAAAALRNQIAESLVAAREEALESSRAKSDFLSRMSHEIRTPMNAIIGMTTIARKSDDVGKMEYCLEKIDNASRQLLDLINDVLDMSKIEANKLEIASNEFDFEKMIDNVFNVVRVKMEEKQLELSLDFRNLFSRKVICDELRLSQVLINLLGNAAKFTPEQGSVSVVIKHWPKTQTTSVLHIEVRDNGIGISKEQNQRLFSAFEQADGSTTRKYGGTGLGLAICKSIVRLMGGDIWVESERGQGSNFIFEVDFDWGSAYNARDARPNPSQDLRVLVVDDSEDVLVYFNNILSNFSVYCDTAQGGQQALLLAEAAVQQGSPYDIAFVDWRMPGLNGHDTLEGLRGILGTATAYVVISVADRDELENDIDWAEIQFLPKPVLPSTLYNTVVSLTSNSLVQQAPPNETAGYNWGGHRILLVEDIEINREIIISILDETGVEIECACDGMEAVDIFQQRGNRYDLILMDVQMPRMDGLEATQAIRSSGLHQSADIPIIAMTANAFREDVEKCLHAGMNGHVSKPVDMDDLFQTLNSYLVAPA